jgi:hypothetical protein
MLTGTLAVHLHGVPAVQNASLALRVGDVLALAGADASVRPVPALACT